jgi:hypothetical protein
MTGHSVFSAFILLAGLHLMLIGCTQVRQLNRFFLTRCPEDGPRPEQEFNVHVEPVDLGQYYQDLASSAAAVSKRVVAEVSGEAEVYPIYHFGPIGPPNGTPILIVAGMHGNELAGGLAAPRILDDIRSNPGDYGGARVHLIAPANPIGLKYGSRYNLQGCDINRDFRVFGTVEAGAIRDVLQEVSPRLILSLHEGPHDGFFVIATRNLPDEIARAAIGSIPTAVMPLANKNNLGWNLGEPGVMTEGWFVTTAKALFGIDSLGAFGEEQGAPTLTTEGPWGSRDIGARVQAQVLVVREVARYFD